MQWFKHDTDAMQDAKLKKLVIRFGAMGYAIYFHCLELIAGDITESNLTFELEHDAEIIADNLHIKGTADKAGIDIVQEIMRYIVELGLFEESKGRIYCLKMLKRLDASMVHNPKFREKIAESRKRHDAVMTPSCPRHDPVMREENRIEQNREERESARSRLPAYGELKNVHLSDQERTSLLKAYGPWTIDDYIERLSVWKPNAPRRVKNDYATLLTWLRKDKIPRQTPENIAIMEGKE